MVAVLVEDGGEVGERTEIVDNRPLDGVGRRRARVRGATHTQERRENERRSPPEIHDWRG